MIVELVGLPGGGKTTIAQALAARGLVLARVKDKHELLSYAFQFEVSHPLLSLRLMLAVLSRAPRGMRYSLYVNGYLHAAAAYVKAHALARAGKRVVIDQGHAQLIVSLAGLAPSLVAVLPKPDVLAIVEAPREVRHARMNARGRTPREEFGAEYASHWDEEAETALKEAEDSLVRSYPRVLHIDGAQDAEVAAGRILEELPMPVVRQASFLKQVTLFFSLLLTFGTVPKGPAVLMYHAVDESEWRLSVSPREFERQMAFLKKHRTPVSLADIVSCARGEKHLPRGAVAVTFDDGYADLVPTVLPILQRYDIPMTLFLTTDVAIATNSMNLPRVSWNDVCVLVDSGLVAIESHGCTHPHLPKISSKEVESELLNAAEDIERELGIRPKYFAYPFGDRSPEVEKAARDAGYDAAFSISEGFVKEGGDVLHLPRIQVDRTMPFSMFRRRLGNALSLNRAIVDFFRP